MKVSSTEVQNNFGKYLVLAAQEEIIITRNGTAMAKLAPIPPEADQQEAQQQVGMYTVKESAGSYYFRGMKASYEEFLELTRDSENRYEYIDGEIYLLASPRVGHQQAIGELYAIFHQFFKGSGCTPLLAPCDIRLQRPKVKDPNVVQPDLLVVCDLEDHRSERDFYMGVPSLVVEVLSDSTRSKDTVKKMDLYMDCGVTEYWLVNPFSREVSIYLFEDRGIKQSCTFKNAETAQSFLFKGLAVPLEGIWHVA
jgi:Uma2 family endonuclease/antitoxin (DNA-binding transcriptional repressor) of toxin-antitoxin stability system